VQRFYARAGKFVLACLIFSSFAAAAIFGTSLGTGLSAGSLGLAASSPAEVVAARFPSADASWSVEPVATFSTASVMPSDQWQMFTPTPTYTTASVDPVTPVSLETVVPSVAEPAPQPTAKAAAPKPEPAKAQAAPAAPRRVATRPAGVLNDAQIANLKRRLNLTPDQEQMWPAVEAALRKVVYTKNALEPVSHAAPSSGRMAYIDPTSTEVQQLKYAALPLIMRLNDDQRREVKMMAHVMGLESVASQF
jgi:hypothetical protein